MQPFYPLVREHGLPDLAKLPSAPFIAPAEVAVLVERVPLHGRGIGWIDAQLLASALIAGADLDP